MTKPLNEYQLPDTVTHKSVIDLLCDTLQLDKDKVMELSVVVNSDALKITIVGFGNSNHQVTHVITLSRRPVYTSLDEALADLGKQ